MALFVFCSPSLTMRVGRGRLLRGQLLRGALLAVMLGGAPLSLTAQTVQTAQTAQTAQTGQTAPFDPPANAQTPANAQITPAPLAQAALVGAMDIAGTFAVMRLEGLAYAQSLAEKMFPDKIDADWSTKMERLYSPVQMWAHFGPAFDAALKGRDVAPILAFFSSPLGRKVINLEIVTRRALLDPARKDEARQNLARMRARKDPRLELLSEFIAVNDMVELNVVSVLNSDLAFYRGLREGNALPEEATGARILRGIQARQKATRRDVIDWMYSHLVLAYAPLSDAQLRAYIAFSRRPAGHLINRALFEAFNAMFDAQSRALGLAAAAQMNGQDL